MIENLIDEFLLTIQANGQVESEKTMWWNKKRMEFFSRFLLSEHIADPLTSHTFRSYAVYLKTRPRQDGRSGQLSVHYRRGCLQVLKRFGHWLYSEGHTDRDLGNDISLPRLPKRPPQSITIQDMSSLLAVCRADRDRALLLVLRDTGCRADELIRMRWEHINLNNRYALVTGKRQKSRFVFFSTQTAEHLQTYQRTVPHQPHDPVWWGHIGRSDQSQLSYSGLYGMLRRLSKAAGIERKWNPHAWRHAFGQHMNAAGLPTLTLQSLMGHESPETTMIYAQPDPDNLGQIYDRFYPWQGQENS
jgi:integrase/recombinase XerD